MKQRKETRIIGYIYRMVICMQRYNIVPAGSGGEARILLEQEGKESYSHRLIMVRGAATFH